MIPRGLFADKVTPPTAISSDRPRASRTDEPLVWRFTSASSRSTLNSGNAYQCWIADRCIPAEELRFASESSLNAASCAVKTAVRRTLRRQHGSTTCATWLLGRLPNGRFHRHLHSRRKPTSGRFSGAITHCLSRRPTSVWRRPPVQPSSARRRATPSPPRPICYHRRPLIHIRMPWLPKKPPARLFFSYALGCVVPPNRRLVIPGLHA
jgi:hypothetical protein